MKFINKIFFLMILSGFVLSCSSLELDLQDNPNAITPDNASLNDLYNSVQLNFAGVFQSSQINPGAMARMYHAGAFSYEAATTNQTFNGLWFQAYSALFPDVDALIALAEGGDSQFDVHAGTAKIMKAYTLMVLVDLLGAVPNADALQGTDVISPGNDGDGGQAVYTAAIALLDEAIAQMTGTAAAAPAYDNFYGGDVTKWITLANTLKFRAALNTGDVSTINSIAGSDIIDDPSEDFQANYGSQRDNPNSRHRMYNNHYEQGDGDYLSNYFMWLLTDADKGFADPRLRYYFYRKVDDAYNQDATTYSCHYTALPLDPTGTNLSHWDAIDPNLPYCALDNGYSGRDHLNGSGIPPDGPIRTSYGLYPGGGEFDFDEFNDTRQFGTTGGSGQGIDPLMMSFMVDLMRAEAVLRLGAAGDARALLESGIRKSLNKVEGFESLVSTTMGSTIELRDGSTGTVKELFGMSEADKDDYVNNVLALYDAAGANQLAIVIKELYIASWGNGLEAYNMYRRTGYPANVQPPLEPIHGNFPQSFLYPAVHTERNSSVDQKADLRVPVFWSTGAALSGNP